MRGWPQSAPRPQAFSLPVQHGQGALIQGLGREQQGTRGHGGTAEADPSRTPQPLRSAEGCLQELLRAGAAAVSGAVTIRPSLCVQPGPALSLLEFSPRRALIS